MAEPALGVFVTFEGGDGAGKTTQTRRLAKRLRDARSEQVLVTREPGGSLIGNAIRALLVSQAAAEMDHRLDVLEMLAERFESGAISSDAFTAFHALMLAPGEVHSATAETLLHFAARAEHWERALKPMLEKYPWVICDRFSDSTMAYQGYAGGKDGPGIGRERIEQIQAAAIPDVHPDITFVMDIDPEKGLARAAARKGEVSSYEMRDMDYHRRVREGFLDIARRAPERCKVIDADQDEIKVAEDIWREVEAFLEARSAAA